MLRMPRPLSTLASTAVLLFLLTAAGCGPGRAAITGTLVLPPNVPLNDTDIVEIIFHPEETGAMPATATVKNADKTFVVKTADGFNVPTGKYKVTVKITPYSSSDSERKTLFQNAINNLYGTESASKLDYDVTDGSTQKITIDLAQDKITKG